LRFCPHTNPFYKLMRDGESMQNASSRKTKANKPFGSIKNVMPEGDKNQRT